MANIQQLTQWADTALQASQFKDYCPNGLQVEGSREVFHIVSGVTASHAFIEAAIAKGADTLLVHHGLFWQGQSRAVVGWVAKRLRLLFTHNLHLLAWHLPLDAHADWGNNAQLGRHLGLIADARFGDQNMGFCGLCEYPNVQSLACHVEQKLNRKVTLIPGDGRPITRLAWCTGGAQNYFEAAIASGADAFLTGEISEPQAHYARETGVAFLACGHHATERYGVQALGAVMAQTFGLDHTFIDIDNPA